MQQPALWKQVGARLRPFLARRVPAEDVDDVLQDVFLRVQRGLAALRDEERFAAWLYQIARSAIADNGRARARRPFVTQPDQLDEVADESDQDDREAMRSLSGCVALFVAQLPTPYREAITVVELEGLTIAEAAELAQVSVSGMKSRVQRGRQRLRTLFEDCCEIALDARGKVTAAVPRALCSPTLACVPPAGSRRSDRKRRT